jgi:sugar/nucleoside kinase (ribokinase family)
MTTQQFDVLGIGNAIVDVLSRATDAFLAEHQLAKNAMQLIDADRARFLYSRMGPGIEVSGGSAANTIAGLAQLGAKAAYIGKIAADTLGGVFSHDIRTLGVAFKTPPLEHGAPTARCLILVTDDGHRTMNTFLGACTALAPSDIDADLVGAARITYVEGYLWDKEEAKAAVRLAMEMAHANKREVAFTLSDPFCVDRHRNEFRRLVEHHVDILFANEAELMSLYETKNFDDALQQVKKHCRIAALTRSEKGAVIVSGDEVHVVDAAPVTKVVDTTGAGDLFAAGFMYGLTSGRDLGTCGRMGVTAAGEVISHMGARPEQDLNTLFKSRGLK